MNFHAILSPILGRKTAAAPIWPGCATIILIAVPVGCGRFDAYLGTERVASSTSTPLLTAARRLLDLGFPEIRFGRDEARGHRPGRPARPCRRPSAYPDQRHRHRFLLV